MRPASPLKISLFAIAAFAVTGCASIVSDSKYPVAVTSSPSGAAYEIFRVAFPFARVSRLTR